MAPPTNFARWQPAFHTAMFAVKTVASALLALVIAFHLGLEAPYWVITTSFIVAQPFSSATRAKGMYRLCGTLLGGVMAIILVPSLVEAPVLLCLALALWTGGCLYAALLDRSPRSYFFMLAGYSAGIIGFQAVANPTAVFDIALARGEEIALGIACTTVIGSLVFPRSLGPVVSARIDSWAAPAQDWALQALAGHTGQELSGQRDRLARDAAEIGMLIPHLSYESARWQAAAHRIAMLRQAVLSLIPILSAVGDRVIQLQAIGGITPTLQSLLDDFAVWLRAGQHAPAADTATLQLKITALERAERNLSWAAILRASLLARLHDLAGLVHYERLLRQRITHGATVPDARAPDLPGLATPVKAHDHGMALLSAAGAALTLLLLCVFWIGTAWPAGGSAAVMASIACSFYAALDEPALAMRAMLRHSALAVAIASAYIFAVLPMVQDFTELVLVMAPYLLLAGVLAGRPATNGLGMTLGVIGSTQIGLQNTYHGDFAGFLNNAAALLLGIGAALAVTKLIRLAGFDWIVRRQLRTIWADIAVAAERPQAPAYFTGRMLDRLGLLLPRMAAAAEAGDGMAGMWRDLRNGLNALALQRDQASLDPAARPFIVRVLRRMARHYRGNPLAGVPPGLRAALDSALAAVAASGPTPQTREALMALAGLRYAFFPEAAPPVALRPDSEEPTR